MILKKFKLRARKEKQFFIVIVYNNLRELRNAADAFDLRIGKKVGDEDNSDIMGCMQPFEKTKIYPDGKREKQPHIGYIRLYSKCMGGSVAAHEVLHAAFWQYRLSQPKELANFGKQVTEKEEDFCHLFDRLIHDFNNKMYKHKLW